MIGAGQLRGGVEPPNWARQQLLRRRGTSLAAQRARPKLYATLDASSVPEGIPAMDPETGAVTGGEPIEPPQAAASAFQGKGHSAGSSAPRPVSPIVQSPHRRRILRKEDPGAGQGSGNADAGFVAGGSPTPASPSAATGAGEGKEEEEEEEVGQPTRQKDSLFPGAADEANTKLRGKGVVMEFAPPGGRQKRLRGAFSGQASIGRQRAELA